MEEEFNYKEKNRNSFFLGVFVGLLASLAVLASVIIVGRMGNSQSGDGSGGDSGAFMQNIMNKAYYIKNLLDDSYYYEYDENELADAIFYGMLQGIGDKYAAYYNKEDVKAMTERTEGRYCGIGVVVQQNADTKEVVVVQITENSPARKAGMEIGDIITGIDGTDATGMDLNAMVSYIKGEEGTDVELTVLRKGERVNITVTRAFIETVSVSYDMEGSDIVYISISGFEENTPQQFKEALDYAKSNNAKGIIFDVRNNSGGTLTSVLSMLDMLIDDGCLVSVDDKNGGMVEYKATASVEINLPFAVLTNQNTASAAELFTAALKDYDKAVIVGKTTYGKGVVQTYRGLPDGTALKFTTAKYFTPKGENIDGVGIAPDVDVELTADAIDSAGYLIREKDPQFKAACDKLREKMNK